MTEYDTNTDDDESPESKWKALRAQTKQKLQEILDIDD
jgi:hypothetical protein